MQLSGIIQPEISQKSAKFGRSGALRCSDLSCGQTSKRCLAPPRSRVRRRSDIRSRGDNSHFVYAINFFFHVWIFLWGLQVAVQQVDRFPYCGDTVNHGVVISYLTFVMAAILKWLLWGKFIARWNETKTKDIWRME